MWTRSGHRVELNINWALIELRIGMKMISFYPSETADVWVSYLRAQVTQGASNHMATEPWCDGEDEDE